MELNFVIIFTNKNKKNTIKMIMEFGFFVCYVFKIEP